jgi:protein-disulfide isomerase-like protein with CxxC motif
LTHAPGCSSAAALIRVGLSRDAVVRALVREIGLSSDQAQAAWRVEASRQAEVAQVRRTLRTLTATNR